MSPLLNEADALATRDAGKVKIQNAFFASNFTNQTSLSGISDLQIRESLGNGRLSLG